MQPTYYTPHEIAGQGVKAVHQRPFVANEDSHIVGRFDSKYAYANFPKSNSTRNTYTPQSSWMLTIRLTRAGPAARRLLHRPGWSLTHAPRPHTPRWRPSRRLRHAAHTAPLSYLAHVADRLAHHLGADPGYTGLITRNPINPRPECYTHWSRMFPYTLGELDKVLPKSRPPSRRQTDIARNCDLFMNMVSEVFRPRWAGILGAQGWSEAWLDHVKVQNVAMFASEGLLPDSECRSIARSCFRYWTIQYDPGRIDCSESHGGR